MQCQFRSRSQFHHIAEPHIARTAVQIVKFRALRLFRPGDPRTASDLEHRPRVIRIADEFTHIAGQVGNPEYGNVTRETAGRRPDRIPVRLRMIAQQRQPGQVIITPNIDAPIHTPRRFLPFIPRRQPDRAIQLSPEPAAILHRR